MVIFRNRNLLVADVVLVVLSYFISVMLINNIYDTLGVIAANIPSLVVSVLSFVIVLYAMGLYKIMWVHSGTRDYLHLAAGCAAASIISMLINIFVFRELYFKIDICAAIMMSIGIIGLRMSVRCVNNLYMGHITSGNNRKRLMIVGAGSSATIVLKDIDNNVNLNYDVVCFIDDDPGKSKSIIHGVRVMGTRNDIKRIAEENAIDEILIALPSAEFKDRKEIIEICNETDCKVKILPSIDQMIDQSGIHGKIRDVQIEDLLAREPVKLDNSKIKDYIEDKVILVTGGGGSIGSELCHQIMRFGPKKLVVLDIYENNAYDLQMELNRRYPDNKPEVVIASVRDVDRIDDIFRRYRPYIVFHAAAHKHVPLMEDSPGEAIKNNVFGTLNVVKCSDKYEVKRFVMISTDKAVNPTNVMGATKRICEMIVQCAQNNSKTEFVAVRFGNVLGSNGSVIPLFKKQIEEGGPVTVTDKRITRFFMTIPEAAQLVLQAASYAKGGEIFVLDMGQPVKIYDLAKNLIRLSGYKPDEEIQIVECGLRPGEKLYEELLMSEEGLTNTSHHKIFIGKPIDIDKDKLDKILDKLHMAAESDNNELIKDAVAEAVPTYVRIRNR
ncbi:MAG: polysaccharide biosynthesis protein [Candidatus Ornithomonoglobus sp.]